MVNQNVTFKFNVIKDTPTSVPVFSETHYVPTDDLGAVNLVIGKGTATTGTFATIDWATGTYYLGIELNTGNGFKAMGTTQLLSVPYALYAKSSGNAIAPGTANGQILYWNGTAWVTLAPGANGTNLKLNNGLPVWENSVGSIASGTANGQLLYWNGTAWVTLAPGTDGKILRWANGSPTWDSTVPNIVLNEYVFYFNSEKNNQLRLVLRKKLVDDGGERISEQGIYYSQTNPTPTENDLKTIIYQNGEELSNPFDVKLYSEEYYEEMLRTENLIPGAQYYIRAYAINSKGKGYSDVIRVTAPLQPDTPVLSTPVISDITQLSANATTKTLSQIKEKNSNIIQGFVWDTNPNPTTALNTKQSVTQGIYSATTISGLTPATTYYVRAFVTNAIGTSYSNEIVFTTLPLSAPSISLLSGSIGHRSAYARANILSDGGATITQKGCVWSTSPNPTKALTTIRYDNDLGDIYNVINGLLPATTYYVRAFATNALGTSYSSEYTFTTLALSAPSVTVFVYTIAQTRATLSGSISSDGGATITQKGFVWSTSPNPTTALTTKSISTASGNYSFDITGLLPATTYFVRAFATNALGTQYSLERVFTTPVLSVPIISSISASSITQTEASASSSISSDEGSTITQKGFVWSTSPNPTTALTTKSISTASGNSIISSITGLSPATMYYLRAFATNAQGTSYSLETTFTTSP
jgi:hypothetical protein